MDNYSGKVVPSVIDEQMILESLEDADSNNLYDITSLALDYKNILKINNIWYLKNLVKLQLSNNFIEKIQGLEELTCLAWLDLSFNYIEKIECLDNLSNLKDLSLFNNKIERIQNLDNLTKLQVFSIGNNNITDLNNIIYLRKFKSLNSLTLEGNPFSKNKNYTIFVVAFLPHLIYLDSSIIKENLKELARGQFEIEIEKLNQIEVNHEQLKDSKENLLSFQKEAFVDKIDGSIMLELMFLNDKEGVLLSKIPPNKITLDEYSKKLNVCCEELHEYGLKNYQERQKEISEFQNFLTEIKHQNKEMAASEINKFTPSKNEVLHNMPMSSSTRDSCDNQNVEELKSSLLLLEVQLVDQIEDSLGEFEQNLTELINNFVDRIHCKMAECQNFEADYYNKITNESLTVLEKILANEISDDFLTGNLTNILMDKDSIRSWTKSSFDAHIQVIDSLEDEIINKLKVWLKDHLQKLRKDEIIRNRDRIFEVIHLVDSLKDDEFDIADQ